MYCMNCGDKLNYDEEIDVDYNPYKYCSSFCEEEDMDCNDSDYPPMDKQIEIAERFAYEMETYVNEMQKTDI